MSRLAITITAFVCALLLMALAAWQLMIYLHPPAWRVALWSPIAGLLHAREVSYIALWLVQFPLLAVAFVVASRRWSPVRVFFVLLVFYALCAVGAYFAVLAHPCRLTTRSSEQRLAVRLLRTATLDFASLCR